MSLSRILLFALLLMPNSTWAAPGEGIPWSTIGVQVYNVAIFALVLAFLLRKTVKETFIERHNTFKAQLRRAKEAKQEAEKKHQQIKERLQKLEDNANENLKKVHGEAEEIRHRIVSEATTLAEKLQEEAERSAQFEAEKASAHLRQKLLDESVRLAKTGLQNKMNPPEHSRLRSEFMEKIQVVR